MADKNVIVVAVNNTRSKNYHTIRTRSSWANFFYLGAAVMLLHNILDGGVVAACQYYGTMYQSVESLTQITNGR